MSQLKYKPSQFNQRDYRKEIRSELDREREILGLFLCHGFIEQYLKGLLIFELEETDKTEAKQVSDAIESLRFPNVLLIHLFSKTIDRELYAELNELNELRNKFAHQLIRIESEDTETKAQIRRAVDKGLDCLDILSKKYNTKIEEIANRIEKQMKK